MRLYKSFLAKICDIENVSVKEIMNLTGKSQAVVYSWLNLSKEDCFPSMEALGKILFRLGISFDDFIHCRHPIYDNGESARIYYRYIRGFLDAQYIGRDLLDLPNADEVLKAYFFDRLCLNDMVKDFLHGVKIDTERFDLLCKALMPMVVSDDGEQIMYALCSDTLPAYKAGVDCIRESQESCGDGECASYHLHAILYPDANDVVLLAAENDVKLLSAYLTIADDSDMRFLLQCYLHIRCENAEYDKKNKIIKKLLENKCELFDGEDQKAGEKYRALLQMVLQV